MVTLKGIGFTVLLLTILIAGKAAPMPPKHSVQAFPSYAGFGDITPTRKHFILVGDTQSTSHWEFWRERNDRERKLVIDEIARREPAFVIHLGDLTTRGSSKKHWDQFDDLHKELREKKIPYFPTLGNHELYGNDQKALKNYFGRFPHLEHRRWYRFTWKDIGFILVDSNFSALTKDQIEQQARWYSREIERFDKDEGVNHIIVCCHEPPFTNSRVTHPNEEVKIFFAGPFVQSRKACLFFSGHSHTYERFQIEGKFFIVSGGGGGPPHEVYINPGKRRYHDLFHGPELRFFHFCEIEIRDQALLCRTVSLGPDKMLTAVDSVTFQNTTR